MDKKGRMDCACWVSIFLWRERETRQCSSVKSVCCWNPKQKCGRKYITAVKGFQWKQRFKVWRRSGCLTLLSGPCQVTRPPVDCSRQSHRPLLPPQSLPHPPEPAGFSWSRPAPPSARPRTPQRSWHQMKMMLGWCDADSTISCHTCLFKSNRVISPVGQQGADRERDSRNNV